MRFSTLLAASGLAGRAFAAPTSASPTATDVADVNAAAATAKSASPTSHVKGKSFDRYVSIWFENTDFDIAAGDPNFQYFAEKGITLSNNLALTHPSEPNYMAAVGGDYFGLDGDAFSALPSNVSSVVDLLEERGISWGMYQEDMPYTGFQGMDWVNQQNGANDYVRKHNPEIFYDSVVTKEERLELIKNTTLFYEDLKANKLPQWMFITPNMTSDGHDTSVTVAGEWLYKFLQPLLNDTHFMNNTLVIITFDENETYSIQNRVFSILLGDSIPKELVGTTDSSYYNHYSEISTVEANWDLFTLGRWDVGANVFKHVGEKTGDTIRTWSTEPGLDERYFNTSYPGIFNSAGDWAPQPVPDCHSRQNGRTILPSINDTWIEQQDKNYYHGQLEIPDGAYPPVYPYTY
ncbi:phosphoesterase family-domain-containing protein [Calycina marina]|uniref:Phosphoesterase family-domain-containing protein n=1 Tax=Calycina marina TaxID=1763456 RepID=A0A9P7Z638_9HELO|nr:phosphoesterase family-domain-containing protein [Calycina marina]